MKGMINMKKFFGVVIAVMLCICMMVPAALAADEASEADAVVDSLVGIIEGVASGESGDILGDLGLGELNFGDLDFGGMIGSFIEEEIAKDEADPQVKVEQALQEFQSEAEKESGIDLSWLTTLLAEEVDVNAVNSLFEDFSIADMPDLLTVISEAISIGGIDMANFDASALGNFDISELLGGAAETKTVKPEGIATDVASADSSMVTTDLVTGIMDGLSGGLEMLGLDVDGLLASMGDNEIINFFANMYIGFIGEVEDTTAPTTTAPAPQKTPDTGDTASVAVALATLCVATAAAGVCLKKKED